MSCGTEIDEDELLAEVDVTQPLILLENGKEFLEFSKFEFHVRCNITITHI